MYIKKDCTYGDPMCPCQDGKECDYEGPAALFVPPAYVRQLVQKHKDEINRNSSEHFRMMGEIRKETGAKLRDYERKLLLIRNSILRSDGVNADAKEIREILDA